MTAVKFSSVNRGALCQINRMTCVGQDQPTRALCSKCGQYSCSTCSRVVRVDGNNRRVCKNCLDEPTNRVVRPRGLGVKT